LGHKVKKPLCHGAQERKRAKDWLEDGLGMLRKQDPASEARVKAFFASRAELDTH
jgi:hypothetical protein